LSSSSEYNQQHNQLKKIKILIFINQKIFILRSKSIIANLIHNNLHYFVLMFTNYPLLIQLRTGWDLSMLFKAPQFYSDLSDIFMKLNNKILSISKGNSTLKALNKATKRYMTHIRPCINSRCYMKFKL